jgi:hypothetical protein
MQPSAALEIALTLAEQPDSVRWVSRAPLPSGVTLLLEVATGEFGALNSVQTMTTRPHSALQIAAAVFIEQVLFTQTADSYRVLGASRNATRKELRRHMALLVKWLHPDKLDHASNDRGIDRSIFYHRVTQAWEDLKSDARRTAYDRKLVQNSDALMRWRATPNPAPEPTETVKKLIAYRSRQLRASRRLVIYRVPNDTLFSRLLYYFGRHA